MSEESAFWVGVQQGAANLNLEVKVSPDGRMALHHLKLPGEDGRPDDAEVERFRALLSRRRDCILKANGIEPTEVDPVAQDALAMRRWLESHSGASVVLETAGGDRISFREAREGLLRNYRAEGGWTLAAFRLRKLVEAATRCREEAPGLVPEAWAADWGIPFTGKRSPACPPGPLVPAAAPRKEPVKERTLFDE